MKKQHSDFCQGAGGGWCNAGGRRGEWSLHWHSSTLHPTPDTGMHRGITGACKVPPLKLLMEVAGNISARSYTSGSVTALLLPSGARNPTASSSPCHAESGHEVIRYELGLFYICKYCKIAQYLLYFLKVEHSVFYPSRGTSEFYLSRIPTLPCSQALCGQGAEHSGGF